MNQSFYILNSNKEPIPTTEDFFRAFLEDPSQQVIGYDKLNVNGTAVVISTRFMGSPELSSNQKSMFETKVLGGEFNDSFWCYESYEQAEAGHNEITLLFKTHYEVEDESNH